MSSTEGADWATSMFSHYVFHITGVAVMVLLLQSLGIPTSGDLKTVTERKQTYSERSRSVCMQDIKIKLGFIGRDVIAICEDHEASYSFHAEYQQEKGVYTVRVASSHDLITTGRFNKTVSAREMVMTALSRHIQVAHQKEEDRRKRGAVDGSAAVH